jgi:hypothetical protein
MSVLLDEVALNKALSKVEAHLNASEEQDDNPSMDDFDALQQAMMDRHGKVSEDVSTLYNQLAHCRTALFAMHTSRVKDRAMMLKLMQRLYREIQAAREDDAEDEASPYEGAASLTKAIAPNASRPVQVALTRKVVEWFGPRGGQAVAYDRELCAKMRLHKSITLDEEKRWRQFGLLHDRVDITNPKAMPDNQLYVPPTQAESFVRSLCPLMQSALARKMGLQR